MEALNFIEQPIVQGIGVLALIAALQHAGFNMWGALASLLRLPHAGSEEGEGGNLYKTLFELHTDMQTLSQHFNHETTDNQIKIDSKLDSLTRGQDRLIQIMSEIKEYGVKIRKE